MACLALPRGDWLLVGAGATLITLAYPPFHLFVPSFVCLAPAVWLLQAGASDLRPLRRHLVQGFWLAFVSNGGLLYWMVFALWRFTPLSGLGYVAMLLLLGVCGALLFALTGWMARAAGVSLLVAFPVMWTAHEWVLGHLGDIRFPWLGLGTSLTGFPTIVQVADAVGARGVTLLLALANAALAVAWSRRGDRRRAGWLAGAVAIGIALAFAYGLIRERVTPLRPLGTVAVLQPNVGVREKWDRTLQDSIVRSTVELSETAVRAAEPDLLVWPEAAVPGDLFRRPEWRSLIAEHVRQTRTPLVVGGLHTLFSAAGTSGRYNSAFVFDSTGDTGGQPVYHKRYLVPVAERVPFFAPGRIDLPWVGGFAAGERGTVYDVGMGKFGILICYESAIESLSREYRLDGASFLVNITNDAWFGKATAAYQHAAHLVMRAIENRIGIARSANSGFSEFVDPLGRQHERTTLGVRTYATATLQASHTLTLYTRLGDWVGRAVVVFAVGLLAYTSWRARYAFPPRSNTFASMKI